MGGVFSQRIDDNDQSISYYLNRLGSHELKWPAHEKQLLAI